MNPPKRHAPPFSKFDDQVIVFQFFPHNLGHLLRELDILDDSSQSSSTHTRAAFRSRAHGR